MIKQISISNFKCFEDYELELGQLTLLTGFNGAGKSSSIQPLLLLSQALRHQLSGLALPLNGPLLRLGSAGDVAAENSTGSMRFSLVDNAGDHATWTFESNRGMDRHEFVLRDSRFSWEATAIPVWKPAGGSHLVSRVERLIFLGAVRAPFAEAQPYPDEHSLAVGDVGIDGRFAAYWLIREADEDVPETRRHPVDRRVTVRAQVDAWLAELFPEANVNTEEIEGLALGKVSFKLGRGSGWRRPSNIGFGLSYALPILVALVCAEPGQIFIVDSPEAHLHPKAQSVMGRILAHFAASGVQVIIESHSDHLLSGVRLAVREGRLGSEHAAVHFFGGLGENELQPSKRIAISAQGEISHWPSGFFDQSINDLIELSA